jgi:FKBP-type peptidyl-prolyl cis-trans isomerase
MRILKSLVIIVMIASLTSCNKQFNEVKSLETELDSVSYAVGLSMSGNLKFNFKEVNKELLMQGISNGLDSTNLLLDPSKIQQILAPYFNKKRKEMMEVNKLKAEKEALTKYSANKKAGEDFMAANKSKPGVITTDSGLQYIVLKKGKGDKPNPTSKIKIHYHGTTIKGEVFDSTVERKKPYETKANVFIAGFNEGLLLMNEGAKYRFFIPQDIAYKTQERGKLIKPFSALIFEVELLNILEK